MIRRLGIVQFATANCGFATNCLILSEVDCFDWVTWTGLGPEGTLVVVWCGQNVKILIMIAASEGVMES